MTQKEKVATQPRKIVKGDLEMLFFGNGDSIICETTDTKTKNQWISVVNGRKFSGIYDIERLQKSIESYFAHKKGK